MIPANPSTGLAAADIAGMDGNLLYKFIEISFEWFIFITIEIHPYISKRPFRL